MPSGGAIRCDSGGAITGTGHTGSRRFLGGAVILWIFCRKYGPLNLSVFAVRPDGIAHHFGGDDRELATLGPRSRPELGVREMCSEALLTDEHTLSLLDDGPRVQRRLQLGGQLGLLLAEQHAPDQ